MWKDGLVAAFHRRTPSETPLLLPRKSRPFSTATLNPVLEQHIEEEQPANRPEPDPNPNLMAATSNEKATLPSAPDTKPDSNDHHRDIESNISPNMQRIKSVLMEEIDTKRASPQLIAFCFMTGFIDAVCFSAIYIWCAFQTGNTVQLSLAIARLFNGQHDYSFHIADKQALCSLLCFISGAFMGRLGDKIGCKTRMWLILGTFIQALFTMAAAVTLWKSNSGSVGDTRGDPAWFDALTFVTIGFISASMGLQGIMGKRLGTQFTTTVVLTTTWCELMSDPQLFQFRRPVVTRDHKAVAIFCLFLGGLTSRALVDKIGSAGTFGVGAGFRFLIAIWWLFAPARNTKQ